MATGRMVSWASCGALAVWLLAGCGGAVAQAPKPVVTPVAKPVEITDVQVSGTADAVQVTVTASAKAAYSLVRQTTPPRLFLLLTGATLTAPNVPIPVHRGAVSEVKASSSGADASVEVFLSTEALYDVEGDGSTIILNVTPKVPVAASAPADVPAAAPESPAPVVTTIAVEEPAPVAVEVAPEPEPAASGPAVLTAIDVDKQADGLVVTLRGNRLLKHDYFLVEGKSLVIDIPEADNQIRPMKKRVDDQWVSQIRIGVHEKPKKFTRVVFDLKQVGEHRVEGHQNRIVVAFGAAVLAAAPAPAAATEGSTIALNAVGPVVCRPHEGGARLEIRTAVKPEFAVIDSGDPAKVVLEIPNAKIAEKDTKTLDLTALNLDVVKVSAFPYSKGGAHLVRVVAQLRRPAAFRTTAENERLVVDFEKSLAPAATAQTPAVAAVPATQGVAPVAAGAVVTEPAATESAALQFTGRRLSLDFKDADVNDILRLISEVSNLNFVAGPEVKGTVSIKLADVPWDLALDLILKTNVPQLAQIRESENIMRITTSDKIMDEEQRRRRLEEDKRKTIDAQEALEPLVTKSFSLSYAETMSAVATQLGKFLSPRGKAEPDERTKTLIVRDVAKVMAEIETVISTLDAPTPGVIVEARIVQMDTNFGRDLGVQWGANFVADQEHNNSTRYAFPNTVTTGGTQGGPNNNYLVNLPAATQAAGVGISFGHIANTMGLDLRLSAMETMGKSKTLSNPRVLVLHNKEAKIHVGLELPLPSTSSTGERRVEFKPIGITLVVTPKVTNDKRVVMKISVSNDTLGGSVQTTEGAMYSVDKKEANTEVIVKDGETTVIGGMYEEATAEKDDGVPGFSKIPILGYLFKSSHKTLRRTELMIFLTPRIVVM